MRWTGEPRPRGMLPPADDAPGQLAGMAGVVAVNGLVVLGLVQLVEWVWALVRWAAGL